jgi:hypothetical protein
MRARALLDAMAPAQRAARATAHAAWRSAHGLPATPEGVLEAWAAPLYHEDDEAEHLASGCDPFVVFVIFVVQPPPPAGEPAPM